MKLYQSNFSTALIFIYHLFIPLVVVKEDFIGLVRQKKYQINLLDSSIIRFNLSNKDLKLPKIVNSLFSLYSNVILQNKLIFSNDLNFKTIDYVVFENAMKNELITDLIEEISNLINQGVFKKDIIYNRIKKEINNFSEIQFHLDNYHSFLKNNIISYKDDLYLGLEKMIYSFQDEFNVKNSDEFDLTKVNYRTDEKLVANFLKLSLEGNKVSLITRDKDLWNLYVIAKEYLFERYSLNKNVFLNSNLILLGYDGKISFSDSYTTQLKRKNCSLLKINFQDILDFKTPYLNEFFGELNLFKSK